MKTGATRQSLVVQQCLSNPGSARPQSAALASDTSQSVSRRQGAADRTAYGRPKAESTPNFKSPRWHSAAHQAGATFWSRASSRQGAFTSTGFEMEDSGVSIPEGRPPPLSTFGLLSDLQAKHNMFPSTRGSAGFASRSPRQLPHEQQSFITSSVGFSSLHLDNKAWRKPSGRIVTKSPRQDWKGYHTAYVNPRSRDSFWNWKHAPPADDNDIGPGDTTSAGGQLSATPSQGLAPATPLQAASTRGTTSAVGDDSSSCIGGLTLTDSQQAS
eukprot:CAMPEP_0117649678 /NCGR_PEP_ID=MMETSP0804-20121206/1108_1 /TAXON_ID=1074897 /ORGANISM="Tetraselmis astigmatica, Strain CCMP880" /LENGTH=270 /DNA_ID=CAMNT_0005455447 /DNA_START=66 /DNA_END=879 /DNA_ORIENTATION=+